jgi:hypothetical protein
MNERKNNNKAKEMHLTLNSGNSFVSIHGTMDCFNELNAIHSVFSPVIQNGKRQDISSN